ncbi:hypothetical protein GGS21DRAFT_174853 [Xylaria nigripes]|nr:hypothetical protein GGS21DRAFT_174853 [Xylaria nigripes]
MGMKARARRDPWWRPELKATGYDTLGDAYDDDEAYSYIAQKWAVSADKTMPYMAWVKELSMSGWAHLRLLSDFMSIGTVPQRWERLNTAPNGVLLSGDDVVKRNEARRKRIERTNIRVLDYHSAEVRKTDITSPCALKAILDSGVMEKSLEFRLYVVEDLSRDVIEILGHRFKIEPDFFRAHVADFAWFNVRDRWRDPPKLDSMRRGQNWMQLRYVTARYFDSTKEHPSTFKLACDEADDFNILRRVDNDLSNKSVWDNPKAIVGLTRSRATLWLQPDSDQKGAPIGILLLDPTVTKGVPLWRGRRTLWPTPLYDSAGPEPPPQQDNFFEDFVFWARQRDLYPNYSTEIVPKILIPMQVLLHIVGSEWLTMSDYIKTRVNQLDWEIIKPEFFRLGKEGVNDMLQKLHMWRRLVPLYREMVGDTIRHLDQFCPRISPPEPTSGPDHTPNKTRMSPIDHYKENYLLVLSNLEEYQRRIDQLTSVVTAIISIDNSQRSLQDNRNIGRLTWLATIFIPLSLVAGILSIQPDARDITRYSLKVYFATSLPLAIVIAVTALILSTHKPGKGKGLPILLRGVWDTWFHSTT